MPIDLRRHDPDDPIAIRPETTKARVIELLYRDTNLGYTPAEIRTELDVPRGTVSGTLSRLQEEGLVGQTSDGLYHGLDHRDDLRRFARSLVSLDTMLSRHPEAGMDPEDIEGTGGSVKREIPRERLEQPDVPSEEPVPSEWIVAEEDTEPEERE
jgi:Mn-dependent DtxR family transcriptional regulator